MSDHLAIEAAHYFAARAPAEWWIHADPKVEGVSVPAAWASKEVLALRLNVEVPTITPEGIRVSVKHGPVWVPCFLPWASIGAIADVRGAGARRALTPDGRNIWVPFIAETDSPTLPHEAEGLSEHDRLMWAVSTPVERRRLFIRSIPGGLVTPPVTPTPTPIPSPESLLHA